MADTSYERCERCGEKLDPEKSVWLEQDTRTNLFHDPSVFPSDGISQGGFPFGSACAAAVIKAHGRCNRIGKAI